MEPTDKTYDELTAEQHAQVEASFSADLLFGLEEGLRRRRQYLYTLTTEGRVLKRQRTGAPGACGSRAGSRLEWQSRTVGSDDAAAKAKRASKTKFTCPSCGQNAWAKFDAALMCLPCQELMLPEDQPDDEN